MVYASEVGVPSPSPRAQVKHIKHSEIGKKNGSDNDFLHDYRFPKMVTTGFNVLWTKYVTGNANGDAL